MLTTEEPAEREHPPRLAPAPARTRPAYLVAAGNEA